jgi:hypothetical protein
MFTIKRTQERSINIIAASVVLFDAKVLELENVISPDLLATRLNRKVDGVGYSTQCVEGR